MKHCAEVQCFFQPPDTEKQIQKIPKMPEITCFQGFFMVKYR